MELLDIEPLLDALRAFAHERNWEQYHLPKNLAMAMAGEAGEVLAELQWLSEAEVLAMVRDAGDQKRALAAELADVMIYLALLANATEVDLDQAVADKLAGNVGRFPSVADSRP